MATRSQVLEELAVTLTVTLKGRTYVDGCHSSVFGLEVVVTTSSVVRISSLGG